MVLNLQKLKFGKFKAIKSRSSIASVTFTLSESYLWMFHRTENVTS